MRLRPLLGIALGLAALAHPALGDLVKAGPGEARGAVGLRSRDGTPPASFKKGKSATSCTATVVDFGDAGVITVTAKHCVGENIAIFDETSALDVSGYESARGDVDLARLEVRGPLPFGSLPVRPSETLSSGERLCAHRVEEGLGSPRRQTVCGRFDRFVERSAAPPLLRVRVPFPRGTSGSPLVDASGRVVGVVVATEGETGLAEPIEAAASLTHPRGPT